MFNLLECSSNYSETTDSEQVYSKDEATNFNADFENTNAFKSLKQKAKLVEKKVVQLSPNQAIGILQNTAIVVPLKYY